MPVQDTSLQAYADLRPSLNARERAVWHALGEFRTPPTAYELLKAMQRSYPTLDLNGVRPRLTELQAKSCVMRVGKRCCRVTGKLAYTWRAVPGHPPVKPQPRVIAAPVAQEASLF